MLEKTEAIVLRTVKYGEGKLIVDMLTERFGRLSFAVRPATSRRGKLKKQLFQPMTLLAIDFDHRPTTALQHLRDVRLLLPYSTLTTDPAKLSVAMFVAEFLCYATRNEQLNAPLYQFIANSMAWLDAATAGYANFHLVFMMRLSRFLGFFPNLDGYERGSRFDLRAASFTRETAAHPDVLSPEESARVETLMRMTFPTMHLFRLSHAERNRVAETVLYYYRLHIAQMPELRSFEVLKDMWRTEHRP